MIAFPYSIFTDTEDFPVHLQYGFHDEELYLHAHADFSELVIVLDGSALHIVGGESYPISKGDVFVVGQNTEHGFTQTEQLTICNAMFRPEIFDSVYDMKQLPGFQALFVLEPHYSQNYHFLSQLRLSAEAFTEMEILLTSIMQDYRQKELGWRDIVFSGFCRLSVLLARHYQRDVKSDNTFLKLADAIAYIEHHFTEQITLAELADLSGYSERQFLRLFREAFSTTPNLYISELRIKKAQQLLKTTNLSIGEIAWRCGYDDQNYFSRFFKKHTGTSPSLIRKRS